MFSSNDLVHLVFADETDTYYCGDLLKLDLHQYLWRKLHETYPAVYFLSLSEGALSVKTYGDLKCKAYEPGRRLWKLKGFDAEAGELGKWMHRQLTLKRSESAAFVCSLEELSRASSYPEFAAALKSIAREKNRTGILVLTVPVSAERSRDLFLYDPVFEYLQENAVLDVRTGALREMYGSIKRNKGEACVFLNTFSRDHVFPILLHVALEQKGRFLAPKDMETVAGYLARYMAGMELRRDHPLFSPQVTVPYMRFRELYAQLKDEGVWKRLLDRSLREKDPAEDMAESAGYAMEYRIVRDRSGYAGKCMSLRLPPGIRQRDTEGGRAGDILLAIQRELSRPKNRKENAVLSAKASGFLEKLEAVSPDDPDTYKRILEAIHFCVARMYTQERSEEEKQVLEIAESLEMYVEISDICFLARKNVELSRRQSISGAAAEMAIRQAQDKLDAQERLLRECQDLVSAKITNLSALSFSGETAKKMEKLKQEMGKHLSEQDGARQGGPAGGGKRAEPSHGGERPEPGGGLYRLGVNDYESTPPV